MPKKKAASAPSLTDQLLIAVNSNDWTLLDRLLKEHQANPNHLVLGSPLIAWAARRGSIVVFVQLIIVHRVKLSYLRENEQPAHILIDLVECRDINKRLALATWLQNNFVKIQANVEGKFGVEHIAALRGQLNLDALGLKDYLKNTAGTYYIISGHHYDKQQFSSAPVSVTDSILDEITSSFTETEEPSFIAYLKKYPHEIDYDYTLTEDESSTNRNTLAHQIAFHYFMGDCDDTVLKHMVASRQLISLSACDSDPRNEPEAHLDIVQLLSLCANLDILGGLLDNQPYDVIDPNKVYDGIENFEKTTLVENLIKSNRVDIAVKILQRPGCPPPKLSKDIQSKFEIILKELGHEELLRKITKPLAPRESQSDNSLTRISVKPKASSVDFKSLTKEQALQFYLGAIKAQQITTIDEIIGEVWAVDYLFPDTHLPVLAIAASLGSIKVVIHLLQHHKPNLLCYNYESYNTTHLLTWIMSCKDANVRTQMCQWIFDNYDEGTINYKRFFSREHLQAALGIPSDETHHDCLSLPINYYYIVNGFKLNLKNNHDIANLPKINLTNKLVHCLLKDNIGSNSLIEYIFKNPACSVNCDILSSNPETNGMSLAQLIFNYARENTSSIDDARTFIANPRNKTDLNACLNRLLAPEDGLPLYLLLAVAEEYPTLEAAFDNNNTNILNPNTSITNIKHRGRTFAWYLAFHGKVDFLKKVSKHNTKENLELNAHSSDPKDKEYGKTVLSYLIDLCDDETIKEFVKKAKDKIDLHACALHPKNKAYRLTIADKLKKLGRFELLSFLNSYAKTPVSLEIDETNPKIQTSPDNTPAEEDQTPQKQIEKLLTEVCRGNQTSYQIEPLPFNKFKVIFLGNLKQISQLSKGAPDFDGPLSLAKDQYQWSIQATEERLKKILKGIQRHLMKPAPILTERPKLAVNDNFLTRKRLNQSLGKMDLSEEQQKNYITCLSSAFCFADQINPIWNKERGVFIINYPNTEKVWIIRNDNTLVNKIFQFTLSAEFVSDIVYRIVKFLARLDNIAVTHNPSTCQLVVTPHSTSIESLNLLRDKIYDCIVKNKIKNEIMAQGSSDQQITPIDNNPNSASTEKSSEKIITEKTKISQEKSEENKKGNTQDKSPPLKYKLTTPDFFLKSQSPLQSNRGLLINVMQTLSEIDKKNIMDHIKQVNNIGAYLTKNDHDNDYYAYTFLLHIFRIFVILTEYAKINHSHTNLFKDWRNSIRHVYEKMAGEDLYHLVKPFLKHINEALPKVSTTPTLFLYLPQKEIMPDEIFVEMVNYIEPLLTELNKKTTNEVDSQKQQAFYEQKLIALNSDFLDHADWARDAKIMLQALIDEYKPHHREIYQLLGHKGLKISYEDFAKQLEGIMASNLSLVSEVTMVQPSM